MADFRPQVWADSFADFFRKLPGLLDYVTRYDQFIAGQDRGDTVKIPALTLPSAVDIVPGSVGSFQTATDGTKTITLDKFRGLTVPITSKDDRLNHADYRNALVAEASRQIKDDSNSIVLDLADDVLVTQEVNTGGGALTDADVLAAKKYLDDARCPKEDRFLVVTTDGENDLLGITTYISKDFGDGQNQHEVPMARGFQVISLPTSLFNNASSVYSCMAFHKSALGACLAAPHVELNADAGQYRRMLEFGQLWGQTIIRPTGVVRVLR